TRLPKETTHPLLKWRCDICRVEAPTEGHLQQHCAGHKHQSKVATLVVPRTNANSHKARAAAAANPGDVRQYDEKLRLTWIQCLLEECKNMAVIYSYRSPNSQPNHATQEE
ncbi:hypothetical protein ACJX0J_031422, partial [Zea mays]